MTKIIEPRKQSNIFRRPSSETGIWSWITTVDHKRIGIMYGYAAFFFLLIGGLEALVLRIQLSQPDNNFLTAAEYNAMFTMHGTTMIFLAIMPISAAFFNYLLPLQIGARDVAFPRLNALSFWIFIFGGAFLYSTFIFGTAGAPEGGYLAEEVGWAWISTKWWLVWLSAQCRNEVFSRNSNGLLGNRSSDSWNSFANFRI